jgi:cation diffusion facilitator CzcD-associated flavoprotein CzcO
MIYGKNPDYEAIVVAAGVTGIYQIKMLSDLGIKSIVPEAADDLGGTWYPNRYPGCRFDSESFAYAYSFSKELLDEWHWKERFSGQPENLRYLNFLADKFHLRQHMLFNSRAASMKFDAGMWILTLDNGRLLTTRFVLMALGVLSSPTVIAHPIIGSG